MLHRSTFVCQSSIIDRSFINYGPAMGFFSNGATSVSQSLCCSTVYLTTYTWCFCCKHNCHMIYWLHNGLKKDRGKMVIPKGHCTGQAKSKGRWFASTSGSCCNNSTRRSSVRKSSNEFRNSQCLRKSSQWLNSQLQQIKNILASIMLICDFSILQYFLFKKLWNIT